MSEKRKNMKWIAGAMDPKHKGEKIPMGKLKSAAKMGGKIGKRANLALTFRGFKHD